MQKDLERNVKYFNVPLKIFPDQFPINTLPAMLTLSFISLYKGEHLEAATRALWQAYWSNGKNISQLDILEEALQQVFVFDAKQIIHDALKGT